MPKSSQAARNSCLSAARRSASRRRQAGSTLKKLNLAKVRSAGIALTIALTLCGASPVVTRAAAEGAPPGAESARRFFGSAGPTVFLEFVPAPTTVAELAHAGFSPGLMSAGLGTVTPEQTYLDIGAGNRAFNSLYDQELPPPPHHGCEAWFQKALERADSA